MGLGFLWNSEYTMAPVFASIYSMVSGYSRFDRIIFKSKKYQKVLDKLPDETTTVVLVLFACEPAFYDGCCGNVIFLHKLKRTRFYLWL